MPDVTLDLPLDPAPQGADPRPGPDAASARGTRRWIALGGLLLLFALPLVVAVLALSDSTWYPPGDLAQTELRVRDVWSSHPPMIGLPGRIGNLGPDQGSHPGPLSFYVLWPAYRILGATPWALLVSGIAFHFVAVAAVLWIAHRRGGQALLVGSAAGLSLLFHYYGQLVLIEPWNPYLPVLVWVLFLMATWSVLCEDYALLPIAVLAGSLCAQTHIPYLGLTVGLGLAAVAAGTAFVRAADCSSETRRCWRRWTLLAVGVAMVVWLPPVLEQLFGANGNLGVIREHFSNPPETPIGLWKGAENLLVNMDPRRILLDSWDRRLPAAGDTVVPGMMLLAAWAASAVVARRLHDRRLHLLNVLIAATVVLGLVSASRVFGTVYPYLLLWAWGVVTLIVLSTGWTVARLAAARIRPSRLPTATRAAAVGLVLVVIASTTRLSLELKDVGAPNPQLTRTLVELVPATVAELSRDDAPGGGPDGRYLLTWFDPFALNGRGYALLLELERRGFEVGVAEAHRNGARAHRTMDPADATAELHLAIGADIDSWRAKMADEIVYIDVRTPAEKAEYTELRARIARELEDAGLGDLLPELDSNLFAAIFDPRLNRHHIELMKRLMDLSLFGPTAIFVAPVGAGAS